MTVPSGVMNRGIPKLVASVHTRSSLQQDVDGFGVAFAAGVGEGSGLGVLVGDVDTGESSSRFDE